MDAKGVPLLVALLKAGPDKEITAVAAATMAKLADTSAEIRDAIRVAGGIPLLVALLKSGNDTPVTANAAGALWCGKAPRSLHTFCAPLQMTFVSITTSK